jgi:type VI secretion system secreted protein Hcp
MWIYDEHRAPIAGSVNISDNRKGSVEIIDLKHQVEIPTDKHTGALTGTRRHHAVHVIKGVDKSSADLFKAVTTGKTLSKVVLRFYHISKEGIEQEYYRMDFEGVKITEFQTDVRNVKDPGSDLYPHLEHIAFRYAKMSVTYAEGNLTHADSWEERSARVA